MTPQNRRLQLLNVGFDPIPCNGKIPVLEEWAARDRTNPAEIKLWSSPDGYPHARNTGIRTKDTPAIDIDIMDADVADRIEELARQTFEEHGTAPCRIGNWPKRALLFRTDEPFKKLSRSFVPANGIYDPAKPPKIEILADGQQVIAFGIHPDTQQHYNWPRGEPGKIPREELAYVREADMVAFLDAAERLLVEEFGWQAAAKRPKGNGADGGGGSADWGWLYANIIAGRELHDSIIKLAGKMIIDANMDGGAVVNSIRGVMEASTAPHDERWQERYDDIPRMVAWVQEQEAEKAEAKEEAKAEPKPVGTLDQVIETFNNWLRLNDATPVYVMLGTVAANLLPGDPVWLGLIAPPSSAKTEILNSVSKLAYVVPAATLTVPALLSGTPKKEKAPGAKGGLLRKVGEFGIMVLKDFGSILSMRPEQKAEILAALREVFDGAWTRHVGSEGGRELRWSGKMGLIFGCTEAYDDHYGVIGSLGDRFIIYRLRPDYAGQLKKALEHRGEATKTMRDELAAAVAGLFAAKLEEPSAMNVAEIDRLEKVCGLAIHLRGHVGRNRHYRDIETVHDPEGPARLGLCLERLFAGLVAIGLDRAKALLIVDDVALASVPQNRRCAFMELNEEPKPTRKIAEAMNLPTNTTRRVLEDITAQGLAVRTREKKAPSAAEEAQSADTSDSNGKKGKKKKGAAADLWAIAPGWAAWSNNSKS